MQRAAGSGAPSGAQVRRGRGRRPAEQVRRGILAAAGQLLLTEGMGGFTIEGVAALAGASKMTIYKWWPSNGVLALDGCFTTVEAMLAFPDTGDVDADLTTQLTAFVHLLAKTPAAPRSAARSAPTSTPRSSSSSSGGPATTAC